MNKAMLLFIVMLLSCFLTSCRLEHDTQNSVHYVQEHADLLLSCAHELEELVGAMPDKSDDHALYYYIKPQDGAHMSLCDESDETVLAFESELCQAVLSDGDIQIIKIWASADEFSLGMFFEGRGNYHYVAYVPTDAVYDILYYDPNMTYTEKDGGNYGEEINGNNTFFYYHIAEQLYYCEAHF